MNKQNFFSWLILGIVIWLILGIILYPYWYYELFFHGQFWNIEFWMYGLRSIIEFFIFRNPILLVAIIAIYFLVQKKIVDIKLPQLNFFSSFGKASIIIVLSICVGVFIWILPNRFSNYNIYQNSLLQTKDNGVDKISSPLDFIYINNDRVNNLFEQIKPELILKEKQLESQTENGKEVSNGENPILNAKHSEKTGSKQTDTYSATEISQPKKVTSLLSHFYSLNLIKEFQTLELSADDVKKLETFRTTSEQFQISFDKVKFSEVYNRVIGESLIKEHSSMKTLAGQVVIKGGFIVSVSGDKILLKHNYIFINDNERITFNVSTLNKTEKISNTLSDEGQNNKVMNLNIFGKVTRVESKDKITDIFFDAYAIW